MCDGLLGERKPPKWLSTLAWSIHRLFARDNNMARVRARVRRWGNEHHRQSIRRLEFDKKRERHLSAVRADRRLRNRRAGPPKRGWVWEQFTRSEPGKRRLPQSVDGRRKYKTVPYMKHTRGYGWVPRRLIEERRPAVTRVRLLHERMSLSEKCATLSAIHDCVCTSAEPVDPWRGEREKWIKDKGFRRRYRVPRDVAYDVLKSRVHGLRKQDAKALHAVISAVATRLGLTRTCEHSSDFSTVRWHGTEFEFTSHQQRKAVEHLWRRREAGFPWVSARALKKAVESVAEEFSVPKVFRARGEAHPAWGEMVLSDGGGRYRIAD